MMHLPPNFIRCCSVGFALFAFSALAVETDALKLAPRPDSERQASPTARTPTAELLANSTFRTVASGLAIVLGVFVLLTAIFRTQQDRRQSTGLLQTLGAIQITPKVQLHVVRFGKRLLVLHLSADSVERVAEISDPDEVDALLGLHDRDTSTVSPQVEQLLQAAGELPTLAKHGGAIR